MLFFGAQTLVLIIGLTTLLELANYSLAIKQNNRRDKKHKSPPKSIFLNTWAVVVHGDETMAIKVAGENGFINMGKVFENVYQFIHRGIPKRRKRESFVKTIHLNKDTRVAWAQQQELKIRVKRSYNDVWWAKQWYLYRQNDGFEGHDLNLLPVWKRGITGKGVVISILDDGIEHTHPELKANYDSKASFDYNSNDTDPSPRSNWREDNRHGTRCAGVAAAVANNSNCIVGVAYGARIGGIRMLDGEITDLVEAQSLSHARGYIDIYSSSWGPQDDGETVEGPGFLTQTALEYGAKYGRQGKGSVVVWASGNGGKYHDSCNCDGYTNSIYTISVSAVSSIGVQPSYSESCASTLVSAYSSGTTKLDRRVMTTDLNQGCTDSHTGTSVSPPIVAGLIALALQVNPNLTWRDVQHILVESSKLDKLLGDDFQFNGAGKQFSHHFGFGIVNAENLVNIAENWITVGEQHLCHLKKKIKRFPHNRFNNSIPLVLQFNTTGCTRIAQVVNYIEHVHVVATFYHYRRGAAEILIVSPSGTESWILKERKMDIRGGEFKNWKFLSNHFWGESAVGLWKIKFISKELDDYGQGFLEDVELIIYGTEHRPGTQKFLNKSIKTSHECHILCDQGCIGSGPHNCISCKRYFYKAASIKYCVESCPVHMYAVDEVCYECLTCHNSCSTCENGSQSDCLSCPSSAVLLYGRCVQQCPKYMFKYKDIQGNFICRPCGSSCRSCQDHAEFCTSCEKTSTLIDGNCIPKCKEAEWLNGETCQPCHDSCKTCNGESSFNCTMCPKKSLNSKENRYLYKGHQCVLNCPVRTFQVDTVAGDCLECPENCLQCSNEGRKCDICAFEYFRVSGEGQCVEFCPKGYYTDLVTRMCENCGHHCKTCVPGNPTACTSCFKGYFLKDHECVSKFECQPRYYVNTTTEKCEFCPASCSFCETADVCTTCFLNYYLTADKKCLETCPSGTYAVESATSCGECSKSCQECDGPASYDCTVCSQGKHLLNGLCLEKIPSGYFANHNGITSVCELCHHTCRECLGPKPENCISCIGELDNRVEGCINPCPKQYLSHNNCQNCHPSCSSCFGPNHDQCLECSGNFTLHANTYTCHKVCQRKFYKDDKTLTCKPCHYSCASCVGAGSNQCLTCPNKLRFFNNSCVWRCPPGWFKTFDHMCARCSSRCSHCIYKFDLCTYCPINEVWHDFKCFSTCAPRMFKDKSNRCYPCHESCNTCDGVSPNQCLSCPQGLSLYNGMCIEGCLPGFFYSSAEHKCLSCIENCLRCYDLSSGKIHCTKCNNATYLQPSGFCSSQCPLSYYRYPTDNICMKCPDKNCVKCEDSGTCLLCQSRYDLVNNVCKSNCPVGTFLNDSNDTCTSCDSFCQSCTEFNQCNNCEEKSLMLITKEQKLKCFQTCPEGYYEKNRKCQPCNKFCRKCDNPFTCFSCMNLSVLFNSTCVNACPLRYVWNKRKNICERCDQWFVGCANCNETTCFQCHTEFYMFNSSCLKVCPFGFVLSSGVCEPCNKFHENCVSCSLSFCFTCKASFQWKESICKLMCPSGFKAVNGTCLCENCTDKIPISINNTTTVGSRNLRVLTKIFLRNENFSNKRFPPYKSNNPITPKVLLVFNRTSTKSSILTKTNVDNKSKNLIVKSVKSNPFALYSPPSYTPVLLQNELSSVNDQKVEIDVGSTRQPSEHIDPYSISTSYNARNIFDKDVSPNLVIQIEPGMQSLKRSKRSTDQNWYVNKMILIFYGGCVVFVCILLLLFGQYVSWYFKISRFIKTQLYVKGTT